MARDLDYYLSQARRISKHREEDSEKVIRKIYKHFLKDLQGIVSGAYVKYAEDDKLTYALLQRAGYQARFIEEVEKQMNISTLEVKKEARRVVEEVYRLSYEGMVDGVVNHSDALDTVFADSVAITPEQIKAAVQNPVSGLTLSDTLEKHRRDIIYNIKQTIGVGLMNGDRYTTMAQRIANSLDGDYYKSIRIVRTETHRVQEAGNHDAAMQVDEELQKGTTGMRMTKTWKTMKDERVRPQRRRKGKKGWSTTMGKGPNHMILNEQTVLEDEPFDLKDGNEAMMPGNSGIAGHDINCRCYASREMMTDAEYFAKTGKHFPGHKGDEKQETMTRKEMRERIEEDKSLIADAKSSMRAVDRDIDRHNITDYDDLRGLKKSDISGRIKAIEEREAEIDPIVTRLYNRPERGTPEYDEWREWKRGIDRESIIEEQMQLATEKAALQSKLMKFDRYDEWTQWKAEHPLAALQSRKASLADEIKRLEDEIESIKATLAANPVLNIVDRLDDNGVVCKAVKKHAKALSESEIISALAGGDLTQGSCASLGLAYMGQKGGLNVLDFRDGASRSFFSTRFNLDEISRLPGVKTIREMARSSTTAGNRLLKHVEPDKEYYLVCGRHAAIVRQADDGALQYLELQSARYSGWHNFDGNPRYTLKTRFGECSGYDVEAFMIEVDSFKDSDDLKQLLGYINTADSEQRKGRHGTIK